MQNNATNLPPKRTHPASRQASPSTHLTNIPRPVHPLIRNRTPYHEYLKTHPSSQSTDITTVIHQYRAGSTNISSPEFITQQTSPPNVPIDSIPPVPQVPVSPYSAEGAISSCAQGWKLRAGMGDRDGRMRGGGQRNRNSLLTEW